MFEKAKESEEEGMSRIGTYDDKHGFVPFDDANASNALNALNVLEQENDVKAIEAVPSADVVERKKGKWEDNTKDGSWKCSECGFISYSIGFYKRYKTKYRMRFCPNCGAQMEES